jgi:hypothetical protein
MRITFIEMLDYIGAALTPERVRQMADDLATNPENGVAWARSLLFMGTPGYEEAMQSVPKTPEEWAALPERDIKAKYAELVALRAEHAEDCALFVRRRCTCALAQGARD